MTEPATAKAAASTEARFSYLFVLGVFVAVVALRLATPLLAALFGYLALTRLHMLLKGRSKWLTVVSFVVLVCGIAYGLGHFVSRTAKALPEIADKTIPTIIQAARERGIELPFSDYDSLRDLALDTVTSEAHYLGSFVKAARGAMTQVLFLVAGCVVAISLLLNPRIEPHGGSADAANLYSRSCEEVGRRFRTFYESFVTVMGAQVIISATNTVLTALFVLVVRLPYSMVIIGATFLCGLLPLVGNLVSNTLIAAIAFTVSPGLALAALVFLVLIHKLEYFLNGKIIGWHIRNPFWLTLLGLIVGERLLGIPGMILAPVVLNYVRLEASSR